MRNKIKGREAGINNRVQSRNVTSCRSLWRPVTQFNTFCFFSCLTSHGLKQPISKNRLPGEQFEEHKQWCDNGWIFFVSHFAIMGALCACALRFAPCPTNPPVLQATWPVKVQCILSNILAKGEFLRNTKKQAQPTHSKLIYQFGQGLHISSKRLIQVFLHNAFKTDSWTQSLWRLTLPSHIHQIPFPNCSCLLFTPQLVFTCSITHHHFEFVKQTWKI